MEGYINFQVFVIKVLLREGGDELEVDRISGIIFLNSGGGDDVFILADEDGFLVGLHGFIIGDNFVYFDLYHNIYKMLRLTQNVVKYGYNGGSYYRRSIQSMPWATEKKQLKKEFK